MGGDQKETRSGVVVVEDGLELSTQRPLGLLIETIV